MIWSTLSTTAKAHPRSRAGVVDLWLRQGSVDPTEADWQVLDDVERERAERLHPRIVGHFMTAHAMPPSPESTPVPGTYLVECYWPGVTRSAAREAIGRAHAAAAAISETGRRIRLVHSTFVAADEAVLSLFEAVSAQAVREASEQASLSVDRISMAHDVTPPVGASRETALRAIKERNSR